VQPDPHLTPTPRRRIRRDIPQPSEEFLEEQPRWTRRRILIALGAFVMLAALLLAEILPILEQILIRVLPWVERGTPTTL
jgi:hypothetical protein